MSADGFIPTGATPAERFASIGARLLEGKEARVPSAVFPILERLSPPGRRKGAFVFRSAAPSTRTVPFLERAAALLLLLLLCPFIGALALATLLCEGRPVFFKQPREGLDGVPFPLFKFRTMAPGAETAQPALADAASPDRTFKLTDDPRVTTRWGNFLRVSFLDELPQLLNIVRGEMRFCGPRPLPFSDRRHYTRDGHRLRLCGKPGLTGLWQIGGRNELTFDEMCLLDVYYLGNRSLRLDLWILAKTVKTALCRISLTHRGETC